MITLLFASLFDYSGQTFILFIFKSVDLEVREMFLIRW